MVTVVDNPVLEVFSRWGKSIEPIVGKGNYSMESSRENAENKKKYARLFLTGNPTQSTDLGGNECATMPAFQIEIYASGARFMSIAYEIDKASHESMFSMGFRRFEGPRIEIDSEKKLVCIISRYRRIYTGQLLEEA